MYVCSFWYYIAIGNTFVANRVLILYILATYSFTARQLLPIIRRTLFQTATSGKATFRQRSFGQPTRQTHPEIMQEGERKFIGKYSEQPTNTLYSPSICSVKNDIAVTPGISAMEYDLRRTKLMMAIPENSVVVSPGYRTRYMSNRVL